MKLFDLITLCFNNLKRRKLRTLLTVLGVVIGTTSVVIMLSLGFGMNALNEQQIAQFGSLTQIQVSNYGNRDNPDLFLSDEAVQKFRKMEHVTDVYRKLQVDVIIKQGIYQTMTQLVGVPKEYFKDIEFGIGTVPKYDGSDLSMVFGNSVPAFFQNTKTKKSYYETRILPDLDYEGTFFVIFDTDKYYQSMNTNSETPVAPPKKYMLKCAGKIAGEVMEGFGATSYETYVDVDALEAMLKKIYGKNPIPGQPTTKKGKPYKYMVYNELVVCCDSTENVIPVMNKINDMGYTASSNADWLQQTKQQTDMIQAMLGGIGAVALLVAAIGIANTMMMSIYERTKEIGIMKVLGCDMANIRNMFLVESGFIGFFGGIFAIFLSMAGSYALNHTNLSQALTMYGDGGGGNISQIPLWLYFASIGFATVVSMLAGLMPALKAMRLSPLTAIRNE